MANSTAESKLVKSLEDDGDSFYYMATVQKPTAITKCIRASFTCRRETKAGRTRQGQDDAGAANEDVEMKEQIDSSSKPKEPVQGEYIKEDNLIFVHSDSLRIFTTEGSAGKEKLELRSEFALNDQVLDIIRIPTTQFGGLPGLLPLDEVP